MNRDENRSTRTIDEDDFSLAFLTSREVDGWKRQVTAAAGEDGWVVQERIVTPPQVPEASAERGRHGPRSLPPLIFVDEGLTHAVHSAVVVKPREGRATAHPVEGGMLLRGPDRLILFTEPVHADHPQHLAAAFAWASRCLEQCDLTPDDLARTWIFMDDIHGDYPALNEARGEAFRRWWPSPARRLPASTGIGTQSGAQRTASMQFWACRGLPMRTVPSPLQPEPTAYGVLFSRALCVGLGRHDLILVSGTASIDSAGRSSHDGDCHAQVRQTLEVIRQLLRSHGAALGDVVQAVIYCKDARDRDLCLQAAREAGLPGSTCLVQTARICREDLLCEIEAHAVVPRRD